MRGSIYEGADEVEMKDAIPRDPYLDDRERGECRYKLKFISAFSKPADRDQGKDGFFKARFEVLSGEGLEESANPFTPGTKVTQYVKPRKFRAHIKDIKRLVAAVTNTKLSTVSEENIDELVQDNPDEGGAGETTGVILSAELKRNERGFLNIHYTALSQN